MAQQLAELTPLASACHFLGAELRHWRLRRHMSLAQLGHAVHVCGALIGKIEKAQRWPGSALIDQLDVTLDTGGILGRLLSLAEQERRRSPITDSQDTQTLLVVLADRASRAAPLRGHERATRVGMPSTDVARDGTVVPISAAERRRRHRPRRTVSTGTVA